MTGLRIFDSFRPVCRIRSNFLLNKDSSTLVPPSLRLVRKEWRDGLKKTASALAGHKFKNCHAAALAAWNLSPGAWAYVARRVDQSEEGWRRKRGLRLLRTISKKRRGCALSFLQLVFLRHGLAQTLHSVLFVAVLEISLLNGVSLGVGCQWLGMPSVLYLGLPRLHWLAF